MKASDLGIADPGRLPRPESSELAAISRSIDATCARMAATTRAADEVEDDVARVLRTADENQRRAGDHAEAAVRVAERLEVVESSLAAWRSAAVVAIALLVGAGVLLMVR